MRFAGFKQSYSMKPYFLLIRSILRNISVLLCVLSMGPPVYSQNQTSVESHTLPNGLTLLIKPDRRAPTAVHMLWVRVGSMDEVDGSSGLAHMLEHMLFKGTPTVKAGEFSRRVAALGGRENAFTSKDYTGYFQQIPTKKLPDVMRLESDRFTNNQWPDEEFVKELEVVKEERRMRTEDQPHSMLYEQLSAVQYAASPYRRPIVRWMSDLDSMKPQDARDFYKRWYVPSNAVVVVVGDVDPVQVKQWANQFYGVIPSGVVPDRKPRIEPEQKGLRRLWVKAAADQSYVSLSFKTPAFTGFNVSPSNQDALALTVLAAVLDGYSGARLDRALTQGEQRLADSAGAAFGFSGRGPQTFTLDGVPAAGKTPEQLEAALRQQITRIAKEGVTVSELNRVKAQWVASSVYKRDSLFNQARELGTYWIEDLPLDTGEKIIESLRAVTPEQVKQVAQTYFGDDALTIAHLIPTGKSQADPKKPTSNARQAESTR